LSQPREQVYTQYVLTTTYIDPIWVSCCQNTLSVHRVNVRITYLLYINTVLDLDGILFSVKELGAWWCMSATQIAMSNKISFELIEHIAIYIYIYITWQFLQYLDMCSHMHYFQLFDCHIMYVRTFYFYPNVVKLNYGDQQIS
jgi:hypothetical protein